MISAANYEARKFGAAASGSGAQPHPSTPARLCLDALSNAGLHIHNLHNTAGVRSAMPGFIAKRLCPHLQFVRPNFEKCAPFAATAPPLPPTSPTARTLFLNNSIEIRYDSLS